MTTLANVRDFLKSFNLFSTCYIGRIDATKNNVLGVYSLETGLRHKCFGDAEKYEKKGVSLLVHGSTNKDATEKLAIKLYNALKSCKDAQIDGRKIDIIDLQQDAPVDVDADDNKVYEFVIEVIFYIKKED